ncbi:MAG: flagellar hook-length control protein FliK [Campylobacterales bacterium]|nr:flagellar hook-length control protein FliK [Campylobacterales bacterium]
MVVQSKDNKTPSSLIDLLGGSSKGKNTKSNDVFAQLLSSLNTPVKNEKSFGVVVDPKLAKNTDVVKSTKSTESIKSNPKDLANLLAIEEKKVLPKELVEVLSNDQVHSLIYKAKEYLKNTIMEKAPEYKTEGKTLPKTLMGLVELADKLGINMSEITLSTLEDKEKPTFKGLSDSLLSKRVIEVKEPAKSAVPADLKTLESLIGTLNDTKTVQVEAKPTKGNDKTTSKESDKANSQPLQSLLKGLKATPAPEVEKQVSAELPKEGIKETLKPLTVSHADPLSALLRGGNESEKAEVKKSEKILEEPVKAATVLKSDSLEVKSKEAVQSMRHFASDLKEAAENYKSPFTRVTMKLNPEKLGEVEVTLVQRGNNVHVNIQSNNASSVAFLAHNATELKSQLAGQGITNATMNFMSGGENQQQNQNGQQQQQQPNRFQSYQSLAELESNEEQLSALEIILPHYA